MSDAPRSFPRLVVGGVASGVGKTTVTVALARALRARGLRLALFKCGPDYLDPTYHARAAGRPSQNLDGWMMGRDAVRATFAQTAREADVSLIEGVMGLYDGASPDRDAGSTAEIAKWLSAPTVLVVDAGGMARSIGAVIAGFGAFDPDVRLAGAIANRLGSRGHLDLLKRASPSPPLLGGLPLELDQAFPERHLGLLAADESNLTESQLDRWGEIGEGWLDVDALLALARGSPLLEATDRPSANAAGKRCRLGVARDEAFHFYYADNLRRLESCGAELVFFSPLRDRALPDVHGLYIGGGYPEVHAAALEANDGMRRAVADFAGQGAPIYAECGGLMYLTEAIVSSKGKRHAMVGWFPSEARMASALREIGYVEIVTRAKTILGPAGLRFRGHQFRHSDLEPAPPSSDADRVYSLMRRGGRFEDLREGYQLGGVLASYVHAHWASNPEAAAGLVQSCVRHCDQRG